MAEAGDVDLIDLRIRQTVHLEEYDCIGLASGIYGFSVHKSIVDFARQYLPAKKPVFFVYTYGGAKGSGAKTLYQIAAEKECPVLGEFSCRGFNTFGPFKLLSLIHILMERRWQNKKMLRAGKHPKGPAKRTKAQNVDFAAALETILRELLTPESSSYPD